MRTSQLRHLQKSTNSNKQKQTWACLDALEYFTQGVIKGLSQAVLRTEGTYHILWSYSPTILLNAIVIKNIPYTRANLEAMIVEVTKILLQQDTANQGGVFYFDLTIVQSQFPEEYIKSVLMKYNVQPVISLNVSTTLEGSKLLVKPQIFTEIKRVTNDQELHAMFQLLSNSLLVDHDVELDLVEMANFYRYDCFAFLGYVGDLTVSSCVALAKHSSIHIFNLATVPELRRRSYGTTILKYTMKEAARASGISYIRAIASESAMGIFHQLGFRADGSTVMGIYNYE